ncbi:MAG TPA: hypothetical protein PKD69_03910, partial [Elusimicrobiota bacterium]|nr:hypothetical protein [Elusimicrobiota bacterium]
DKLLDVLGFRGVHSPVACLRPEPLPQHVLHLMQFRYLTASAATECLRLATAYMDEAERCAHVHLMENGRVLAAGAPRDLLSREGVRGFSEYFIRRAEGAGPIGGSR